MAAVVVEPVVPGEPAASGGRLEGRVALVTGASRGLGAHLAHTLHAEGAVVYGTSRNAEDAARIAQQFGTAAVVLDTSSAESIDRAFEQVVQHAGRFDILVNNAGINIPRPLLEITEQQWDSVFDTNVKGVFLLSQQAAAYWVRTGQRGNIVNIASQTGVVVVEDRTPYGTSKAALIHLSKYLAVELAAHGVRVNTISPTFVRTEMTAATLAKGGGEFESELISRIPIGRLAEPSDLDEALLFLVSNGAGMVTGQNIVIDGGYTLR